MDEILPRPSRTEQQVYKAHGSRCQRYPDPVRVEQINPTSIVCHIRCRIHRGIALVLLETIASDDAPSGWQDTVSTQE